MARLTKRLTRAFVTDPKREGLRRSLRGLRDGDYRELSLGLALTALAYLRSTRRRKELIYRKTIPTGTALVIHHKRRGKPKLEIRRP